jgi:hypothetical protein
MLGTERPPLDGSVRSRVDCQEEWAYIDADSQETRQLDGLIALDVTSAEYKPYPDSPRETIRCSLDLLIECKQSELPFLFFMRRANTGDVPRIVGLPHEWLSIGTDDHPDIHLGMRPYDALGFYSLPLARRPSTAISMTKAQWKSGSVLQLSGEDVFRGIALPLSKAVRYYETMIKPKEPTLYTDVRMVVPVAVVRAPMIGVSMEGGQPSMLATPWVRLVRLDPGNRSSTSGSNQSTSIDVVHIDFVEEYARVAIEAAMEAERRIAEFAVPGLG